MLFVVLNLFTFCCVAAFFPETKGECIAYVRFRRLDLKCLCKGKSLEDMAEIFGDQVDPSEVLAQHGEKESSQDEKAEYA